MFGTFECVRVGRAGRRGHRATRVRQRHVAHRLADDLPDGLQEGVAEVSRAVQPISHLIV